MNFPTMREYKDADAQAIKRFPLVEPYEPFEPEGPAFTLEVEGEIMACVGYEIEETVAKCWMILSPEAIKHPRTFWAIRSLLQDTLSIGYKKILTVVRTDWPEAQRFAGWVGMSRVEKAPVFYKGFFYDVYERVA